MIDRIIKKDLTSRLSWTITDVKEDGTVIVSKNTNSAEPEPYEGVLPEGIYIVIADLRGMDWSRIGGGVVFDTKPLVVDKDSKLVL